MLDSEDTGGMAEWSKAAVLKTVERKFRGFESYFLRRTSQERWVSGLNQQFAKLSYWVTGTGVRIPSLRGTAPVAQFDRAPDCGSGGQRFESSRAQFINTDYNNLCLFLMERWPSWFKAHAWKACVGLPPPRVQIPPFPLLR